jgi:anti-sigma-K factor RskA
MSEQLDDSVAAHALNALPEDERDVVETAIEFDEELNSHYQAHRRIAAELVEGFSDVVPAASPLLWDRIALEAGLVTSPDPSSADAGVGSALPKWRRFTPIIAGVAAVLVAVSLTAGLLSTRSEPAGLEALASASADLEGSINVELIDPAAGTAVADVVVTTDGEGFIDGSTLPTLAENRTYQLWAIVGERVISVGIMGNRPETTAFRVEGQLAGLAISEEILGGVVVSEQDPVGIWLDEA